VSQTPEALIVSLNLKGANEATVTGVFDEVLEAARTAGGTPVVLDLSQVSFLPSHAIGCVIRVYKTCVGIGQAFAVTGVNDDLRKVFTEMRLDTIFTIYPTPEAAICELTPVAKG
jgi:anti-anti-sigma factor